MRQKPVLPNKYLNKISKQNELSARFHCSKSRVFWTAKEQQLHFDHLRKVCTLLTKEEILEEFNHKFRVFLGNI